MALTKQPVNFDLSQGLNTKDDPFQIGLGKFLNLENTVFTTGRRLTKRNGYAQLMALPDTSNNYLTTFNGNLTAIGSTLNAYSSSSDTWVNKGNFKPTGLDTLPIIRSSTNQSQCDVAIAPSGLMCTVYTDSVPVAGTPTNFYKYAIADSVTGQNIVSPTALPNATGAPKVFILGNYFVILFTATITGVKHLQYIAVSIANPSIATAAADITSQYIDHSTGAYDAVVTNNNLYVAWNASDGGGAVRVRYLTSSLVLSSQTVFAAIAATIVSVTADNAGNTPVIYINAYDEATTTSRIMSVSAQLAKILNPLAHVFGGSIANVTLIAHSGTVTIFYEVVNAYTYDSGIPTNYIQKATYVVGVGYTLGSVILRSVGIASKAFFVNSSIYLLAAYSSPYQPTYFLIDSSGNCFGKLAYSNGGGYLTTGLPNVSVSGVVASIPYLIKDTVIPVNKTQGLTNSAPVYSQTGVNLASFSIGQQLISSSEIANNLNVSGGILWSYDGYTPVEQGFHLWPDSVETTNTAGGSLPHEVLFYVATYEWSDNQGNLYRSAPSIPVKKDNSGGGTDAVIVSVPTLRVTYKTANPIKIVIYRWSTSQQTYYQATSITNPVLNDPSVDYVQFTDGSSAASILGNSILYTTGGVVENIGPPAASVMALYKSRLFLVDAEDKNLVWYSKQVIENVPVEMSDLFTIYVAPTTSAQGNTGPITALSAMDDKLIIFKRDAIYYVTGTGPDNTGANNDFSDPIFVTSTIGCSNQQSIVFIPQGLLFQSDKGIWLLGRDLSTTYVGAPVERYNDAVVQSAVSIPATNQVRFTLSSGVTLMYDYFYGQWGTFNNVPCVSSTLYQSLHSFIDQYGRVFQETPGLYLDGANPVLISLTTGWLNLAGLQGYERAYNVNILGTYLSPHKINMQISYDYDPSPLQQTIISPTNFNGTYGQNSPYGNQNYGGSSSLEQWKVHLLKQTCESFQITITEIYDPFFGVSAGAGFTLSGVNCTIGIKKGLRPIPIKNTAG